MVLVDAVSVSECGGEREPHVPLNVAGSRYKVLRQEKLKRAVFFCVYKQALSSY
jgi:hypothetical protein